MISSETVMNSSKEMVSSSTNIHVVEAQSALKEKTIQLSEEISELLEALTIVGEEFSSKVLTARTKHCVAGHYARLRGNNIIQALIPFALSSKEANKMVGMVFRNSMKAIYEQSGIMNQSLNKPYGNPGDFSLLELVYEESAHPYSTTAVGRAIDQWAIHSGLATAVVDRKNALRLFIEEFGKVRNQSGVRSNILSIASGAARELRELPLDVLEHFNVKLLDIDPKGMAYAKAFFDTRPVALNVETIEANALSSDTAARLVEQGLNDLVYSFGLYDYLNDELLLKSIAVGLDTLKQEGTFIFCLKDHRFFDAWLYDWMMNWRFYPRVKADGIKLAEQAGLEVEEIYTVEGKAVNVYICKRQS